MLWCTQGVREVPHGTTTFRTVPSAGARHALETYLLVNNIVDVPPGLYRFLAVEHNLTEVISDLSIVNQLTRACLGQRMVSTSAVTFFWVAIPRRMTQRYGQRGYRYLFLDAGHVCQNLYLAAECIGCGVCAIAAYDDDDLNAILDLDGEQQFVIYLATLGKKIE